MVFIKCWCTVAWQVLKVIESFPLLFLFLSIQGVKLTFSRSHLAPKYFKVVANSKKLVVIMTHTQTIFTLSLYQID